MRDDEWLQIYSRGGFRGTKDVVDRMEHERDALLIDIELDRASVRETIQGYVAEIDILAAEKAAIIHALRTLDEKNEQLVAERGALREAARCLADEAERVTLAARQDWTPLVALENAIAALKEAAK